MKNALSVAFLAIIGLGLVLGCRPVNQKTKVENTAVPASMPTPLPVLTEAPAVNADSPEYQLAVIDAGYALDKDDVSVKRFRFLIQSIQRKTGNTPQQIADMTVNAQKILLDRYGKEVKLPDLMEQANKAIPEKGNQKYEDIITALVLIMGE